MTFAPCFVVPVYNHGSTVGATVAALAQYRLPIYLVDDGSEAATAEVLDRLANRHGRPAAPENESACRPHRLPPPPPSPPAGEGSFESRCRDFHVDDVAEVRLVRRAANGGKGAAVMSGMQAACGDGLSHALQVDADGQHDLEDIAGFFAAAAERPEALICGVPRYDASVPKGRLYGRYATHVWVWIETLSFAIEDSMCGFRVYPLAPCCRLFREVKLGTRMDFDIEVLVRLFWRGVAIVNRPTRVIYPEGGISHFRPLSDNLAISWLHTRLFFGMLLRLPLLLGRKVLRHG